MYFAKCRRYVINADNSATCRSHTFCQSLQMSTRSAAKCFAVSVTVPLHCRLLPVANTQTRSGVKGIAAWSSSVLSSEALALETARKLYDSGSSGMDTKLLTIGLRFCWKRGGVGTRIEIIPGVLKMRIQCLFVWMLSLDDKLDLLTSQQWSGPSSNSMSVTSTVSSVDRGYKTCRHLYSSMDCSGTDGKGRRSISKST